MVESVDYAGWLFPVAGPGGNTACSVTSKHCKIGLLPSMTRLHGSLGFSTVTGLQQFAVSMANGGCPISRLGDW